MKRILYLMTLAVGIVLDQALPVQAGDYGEKFENYPVDADYQHAPPKAYEDWRDRKFGLRIHWGVYSALGLQESWPFAGGSGQFREKYQALYTSFNPTDFSGDRWAELMKRSGFKYFTFVTKHHDGFAMWDTQTRVKKRFIQSGPQAGRIEDCDLHYDIMETPFGRDILKELIDATHKRGISTGLYFSHADWYDADFRLDRWNPHRDANYSKQADAEGWKRFVARHREQVRELLTNYGKVDQFEWDLCFPESAWPDVVETVKMARQLQPDVLMRDRGIGLYGDIMTPEMWIPQANPDQEQAKGQGQIVDKPWQVIIHMGEQFSYDPKAENYKSAEWALTNLIDIVSKGGNFMVGIGPDGTGNFHPVAVERLERVGRWLAVNGEAIYKTRPYRNWNDGDHIRYTRSKDGRTAYAMSLKWPGRELKLRNVRAREGSEIRMLGFEQPLAWRQDQEGLAIEIPDRLQNERQRPCELAWAFKIEQKAMEPPTSVAIPGYVSGLEYRYYEGAWEAMPEAIVSVPFKRGTIARFDLSAADRKVGFAFDYRGYLRIDQEGDYTLYTTSDAGSRLQIEGKTVVDNDCGKIPFGFPSPHEAKGLIALKKGLHPIHLIFYTDRFTPEPYLRVDYEGSGVARREIPTGVLYHPQPVSGVRATPERPRTGSGKVLALALRTQHLAKDARGMNFWRVIDTPVQWRADETMLVIIDMWNKHWCLNGCEAPKEMFPRFSEVVKHARNLGVQILHSPTEPAMGPYYSHPAYKYMATFPHSPLPPVTPHDDYPLPLDVSDQGANGPIVDVGTQATGYAQLKEIDIVFEENGVRDGICEPLQPVWNLMQAKGIRNVIVTGCAANMCLLGKPLGIRNLVAHGINVVLVRDLTRPMYNPASPPYVNLPEATRMMTEYVEKFWCPTVGSEEILRTPIN